MVVVSVSSESSVSCRVSFAPFNWTSIEFVGRESEASQLSDALQRVAVQSAGELFLLRGGSGVGKSSLLNSVFEKHSADLLLKASGKFDQNEDSQVPFGAFIDATAELVHGIIASDQASEIRALIESTIHEDELSILSDIFPAVCNLLPNVPAKKLETKDMTIVNESLTILSMITYRRFLSAISTGKSPLVIFLDDVQWADKSSRKLLDSILRDGTLSHILVIGAVRDGEKTTYEAPADTVFRSTDITLSDLSKENVNLVVARATELTPEKTQSLGQLVFNRTMGNPYFVRQFLDDLYHQGLLKYVEKENSSFTWDVQDISNKMKPSVGVADILVARIKALDKNTQLVLIMASIIGHTFTKDVLEPITSSIDLVSLFPANLTAYEENQRKMTPAEVVGGMLVLGSNQISKSLSKASRWLLIESTADVDKYRFTHDRVQQAAHSLLPGGKLGHQIKSALGSIMLELSKSNPDESWMLFSATNLLCKHGKGTISSEQLAGLCAKASAESIKQTAFEATARYADAGIKALGQLCWKDDTYDLCLELHNLMVEGYFADGNFKRAKKQIVTLGKHCRCLPDRFRAFNVLLRILIADQDFVGCISECLVGLAAMGIRAPKHATLASVAINVIKAKRKLKGRSAEELESLPTMTNTVMLQACRVLLLMGKSAWYSGDSNRLVCSSLQAFQIILEYGLNSDAPMALTAYGMVLAHFRDIKGSYDYGVTASKLARRPDLVAGIGAGESTANYFLLHLGQPLVDSLNSFPKVTQTALEYGDAENGCQSMAMEGLLVVYAGSNLFEQEEILKKKAGLLKEYKNRATLAKLLPYAQFVENLRGKSADARILCGSYMDERDVDSLFHKGKTVDENRMSQMYSLNGVRSMILYLTGEHLAAEKLRLRYIGLKKEEGNPIPHYFDIAFLALNCYELVRLASKDIRRSKLLRAAASYVREIKFMGKAGSPTSAALLPLLEAERLVCKGKHLRALEKYSESIRLLSTAKLFLVEAIACERLAICLRSMNDPASDEALQLAWQKFKDHGAVAKLDRMTLVYPKEAAVFADDSSAFNMG